MNSSETIHHIQIKSREPFSMSTGVGYVAFRLPPIIIIIKPEKISLSRGESSIVTANLTYKYEKDLNLPNKVIVKLVPTESSIDLEEVKGLSPHQTLMRLIAAKQSGTRDPGFFYLDQLVTTPTQPIDLNAEETKSVKIKITIPENIPDELLTKTVGPGVSGITTPYVGVMGGGIAVTIM